MTGEYDHQTIEKKWQEIWKQTNLYQTPELKEGEPKKYILETFPYPSGYAMHVGHAKGYVASDVTARYWRSKGYKVIYPMGWDAFGLPAENYAIKTGIHPRPNTDQTIEVSKSQLYKIGLSYDWSREIATHRPDYYRWTQWFFELLYKRGLAYKKEALVNWDPVDQTVLANEQVLPDGTAERSGAKVEQKLLSQWFFKITAYADRLVDDLEKVDWPESTKLMQKNWIGRSEGINITYPIEGLPNQSITVYTTRPETNFGATFIVVAPDSPWVKENFENFLYKDKCQEYIAKTKLKTELDRLSEGKIKTGEFTGLEAVNHFTGRKMPIYLSDFVLATVGTGAVVGVPGHDVRDFDFAQVKNLPIIRVIVGPDGDESEINRREQVQEEAGTMINSGFLDGLPIWEAKEKIKDYIEDKGWGKRVKNYRLRDWSISRQRYWGAPIPIVYKPKTTTKILYASVNPFKIERFQQLVAGLPVQILTLNDLSLKIDEPPATGQSISEISKSKAIYYWEKLEEKIPVVREDIGVELINIDPEDNPGLDIKQRVEAKFGSSTDDQIVRFYSELAAKYGGEIQQSWQHAFTIYDGQNIQTSLAEQKTILVSEPSSFYPPNFPLAAVTKIKVGDELKYYGQLSIDEIIKYSQSSVKHTVWTLLQAWLDYEEMLVPEEDLPVILPDDVKFHPTGRSPLLDHQQFHQSAEQMYGPGSRRESDTMDTFVDSSWYFFRYCSPKNTEMFSDPKEMKKWMPVDQYIIGAEHSNLHLLYARFFTKVLFDAGFIDFDEPFLKVRHQGLIQGEDGRRMSKRWGNVVNPDDICAKFGADTLRVYEMFMGPFKEGLPWSTRTIKGVKRFMERIWKMQDLVDLEGEPNNPKIKAELHKLIKKVGEDIEDMSFNTAVAEYMKFVNTVYDEAKNQEKCLSKSEFMDFLKILSPFAPFITEELWTSLNQFDQSKPEEIYTKSIHTSPWPKFDENLIQSEAITIGIQINGKRRAEVTLSPTATQAEAEKIVLSLPEVQKWTNGQTPKKFIYVPGKIVNLVI